MGKGAEELRSSQKEDEQNKGADHKDAKTTNPQVRSDPQKGEVFICLNPQG